MNIKGKIMREKIKVVSSAGTGHFYTTTKNKKTMPDKFQIKKFDPVAKKSANVISAGRDKKMEPAIFL